ncbi:MAG TPA: DUF2071 domain-containing protein [Candidatus Limnocylindrales bacterium]|jgi:uncharacterized protein YqjF (DUF2071 family)|nr:DUF2071 domain-containing protein [Candidatus Limnocylindrales bacterium]
MHPLLLEVAHRTAPLPQKPWVGVQTWNDLLFAHWKYPLEHLRILVPAELQLDLFEGEAYVGVVPFWMSGVRGRWQPPIPGVSRFPEMNVRTYVRVNGIPGVYFFSLDAASRVAVWGARMFYHLPYFFAEMSVHSVGEKVHYKSRRLEPPAPAEFRGLYWPAGAVKQQKSALENFLSERYCLYTVHRGRVYRAYIHHLPWPLQPADAEIDTLTVAQAQGLELPQEKPMLHFSRTLDVLVWPIERV